MANLTTRLLSALALAPLVLLVVYAGPPYLDVLLTIVSAALAWEWARLCGAGELDRSGYVVIVTVTAALAVAGLREYAIAGWIVAAGAMGSAVLAVQERKPYPFWYALGTVYIALTCTSLMWLREYPAEGRSLLFWLLFVVWATDSGAYAAGRTIGGPKLAPSISPNKTWAGLGGGMASAALVGTMAAWLLGLENPAGLALISALIAVIAQAGDLLESSLKRRFGAKESSNLIPGHGGLLDRLDGVLAAGLAVAALVRFEGGVL